jgi:hypothetical protein
MIMTILLGFSGILASVRRWGGMCNNNATNNTLVSDTHTTGNGGTNG